MECLVAGSVESEMLIIFFRFIFFAVVLGVIINPMLAARETNKQHPKRPKVYYDMGDDWEYFWRGLIVPPVLVTVVVFLYNFVVWIF